MAAHRCGCCDGAHQTLECLCLASNLHGTYQLIEMMMWGHDQGRHYYDEWGQFFADTSRSNVITAITNSSRDADWRSLEIEKQALKFLPGSCKEKGLLERLETVLKMMPPDCEQYQHVDATYKVLSAYRLEKGENESDEKEVHSLPRPVRFHEVNNSDEINEKEVHSLPRPVGSQSEPTATNSDESDERCSICLDDFGCAGESVAKLGCGHSFHVHCITAWYMKQKFNCPNCRAVDEKIANVVRDSLIHYIPLPPLEDGDLTYDDVDIEIYVSYRDGSGDVNGNAASAEL